MKAVVVVPARYASSRFPGKPLALFHNRPLIAEVYERAAGARYVERTIIATDDQRIADAVISCGGTAMLTPSHLRSGTDRVASLAQDIDSDLFVNLQGDELLSTPQILDDLILLFSEETRAPMGTLKREIRESHELFSPHVVKVVCDSEGYALYFSRAPIPYRRERTGDLHSLAPRLYYKHIGIYIYRRDFLLSFSSLPTTVLEEAEKLEQLRALEMGYRIRVYETTHDTRRVDTPEDLGGNQ